MEDKWRHQQHPAGKSAGGFETEKEMMIFRRGRNFHTGNTPKSATAGEYHAATGLECLFGFLHLSGQNERIEELFALIW